MPALNALRAFEAIARHLSFARAADELHVTPAALSHQIRGLEQEVGVALFHRRTRAIELTDAGKLIYPGIHAGFASLRNAVGQIARARDHNVLVISATPGLVAKWLMPRLWRFLHAHPEHQSCNNTINPGTYFGTIGILYFPGALLHYAGGGSSNINATAATIIAYNLQLNGSSYIWNAGSSPYLNTFSGYAILE